MFTQSEINRFETSLLDYGIDKEARDKIHNSKICLIDDKIDDLRSMTDGLRREGFSNLVEYNKVGSVNELLSSGFSVIILDLNDVAQDISDDDGFGVLLHIKDKNPLQKIIVVTGQLVTPEKTAVLGKANYVRRKPVKQSDLAHDIENLLKFDFDPYWKALDIIKLINNKHPEIQKSASILQRFKVDQMMRTLSREITSHDPNVIATTAKILGLVKTLGEIGVTLYSIIK